MASDDLAGMSEVATGQPVAGRGIDITAEDCGPGLLRLMFSRSERWFWRHRKCSVEGPISHLDRSERPYQAWQTWECRTHASTWIDRGDW